MCYKCKRFLCMDRETYMFFMGKGQNAWVQDACDDGTQQSEGTSNSSERTDKKRHKVAEEVKVIARESNTWRRKVREAAEIRSRKPEINWDNGCGVKGVLYRQPRVELYTYMYATSISNILQRRHHEVGGSASWRPDVTTPPPLALRGEIIRENLLTSSFGAKSFMPDITIELATIWYMSTTRLQEELALPFTALKVSEQRADI